MSQWRKSPQELVDLFETMLDNFPEAEKRKMFGYPCRFLKGNMFTGLHQENWVIRLPEKERLEMINRFGAKGFEPMPGRRMKEYMILPEALLSDEALLLEWLQKSFVFAQSLPLKVPKPRKKKM